MAVVCNADALSAHSNRLSRTFPTLHVTEWSPRDARLGSLAVLIAAPPELQCVATVDSIRFFEGYLLDHRLLSALDRELTAFLDDPQQRPGSRLAAACGLFSAGASNGEEFVLIPDPLGMNVVFFGQQNGATFISNRYSLMARAFGQSAVDAAHLALAFARRIKLGDETSVSGVRSLPFGCWLEVDGGGLRIVPGLRRRMEEAASDASQYERYLESGMEEVRNNLASPEVEKPSVFSLSGGLDSRLVLSAILAANLQGEFLFHTRAGGDDDEMIATRLIDEFALKRLSGEGLAPSSDFYFDERDIIEWTAELVCEHRNPDGSFMPSPTWQSGISLTGGQGGETFRGFYTSAIAKQKGVDMESLQVNIDDVVRATANVGVLSEQGRDFLRQQTAASMPDFPQEQMTRVDLLYPLYRNRYHFGLSVRARNLTAPSYILLYAPSLLLASMCIPPEDRACGRVSFDFISGAFAPLLSVPGTYRPWPKRFLDRLGRAPAEAEWQQPSTSQRPPTAGNVTHPKPLLTRTEARRRIVACARDGVSWLRDSVELSPLLNCNALEQKLRRAETTGDTSYPFFLAVRAAWVRRLMSRDP